MDRSTRILERRLRTTMSNAAACLDTSHLDSLVGVSEIEYALSMRIHNVGLFQG